MADNLTNFMCRLSRNLWASNSWNPQGLSKPVIGLLYLYLDGGDWFTSRFGRFNPWKEPEWPLNRKPGRSQRISAGLPERFLVPGLADCSVVMPKMLYVGLQTCKFVCVQVSLLLFIDASSGASVVQYRLEKQSWTKNWTAYENPPRGLF